MAKCMILELHSMDLQKTTISLGGFVQLYTAIHSTIYICFIRQNAPAQKPIQSPFRTHRTHIFPESFHFKIWNFTVYICFELYAYFKHRESTQEQICPWHLVCVCLCRNPTKNNLSIFAQETNGSCQTPFAFVYIMWNAFFFTLLLCFVVDGFWLKIHLYRCLILNWKTIYVCIELKHKIKSKMCSHSLFIGSNHQMNGN